MLSEVVSLALLAKQVQRLIPTTLVLLSTLAIPTTTGTVTMPLVMEEYLPRDVRDPLRTRVEQISADPAYRRVIAVVNQKGGAGKTTTAVTLGATLAAWGLRVRLLDADPQLGSATFWLPPQWSDRKPQDLRAVFFDEATLDEATAPTTVERLDLVPSDHTLGQVEYAKDQIVDVNSTLQAALEEAKPYAFTLLDCRPSLGALTVSALAAATEVLVPLGASGMDVPGLIELNRTLRVVRKRLNPDLRVSTVVVCHDSETLLSGEVRKQLATDYPDAVRGRIRRSVRVEEAPFAHQTLLDFAPRATPTIDYAQLAARMLLQEAV